MPKKKVIQIRGRQRRWTHFKCRKRRRPILEPATEPVTSTGDADSSIVSGELEVSNNHTNSEPMMDHDNVTKPSDISDHEKDKECSATSETECMTELVQQACEQYTNSEPMICMDHDYVKKPSDISDHEKDKECSATSQTECMTELVQQACEQLKGRLPPFWSVYLEENDIHVILLSRQRPICVQRSLCCSSNGHLELHVHCNPIPLDPYLQGVRPQVQLSLSTVDEFCEKIIEVVMKVRSMEVCAGVGKSDYSNIWGTLTRYGKIDQNPYQECRYAETFRSLSCLHLVESNKWTCQECFLLNPILKKRQEQAKQENVKCSTRNDFLTEEQKLIKLKIQREKLLCQKRRVNYLEKKILDLIAKDGVNVEENLSNDLYEVLRSVKVTPAQAMFLQQQMKASQRKNMCGMRWHPSMIRIALAICLNSPSTYNLIRDSGVIKLPSSRTLFDYSHPDVVKEGVSLSTIRDLEVKVNLFQETYKQYHILMADEMYTSKNLVYHKTSGELRGYVKLNDLDQEIKLLENFLDDPNKEIQPEMSSKILSFLVKGVCTSVKAVVATYCVRTLSVVQFHSWTWDVITYLERYGIKVVAFTCDGSPINRSLMKMHAPLNSDKYIHEDEVIPGSAVYATINIAAPERNLYFICDVPHLLKTIRNCFSNSRMQEKKGKRCLKVNGEIIAWDTIIKLYNLKKDKMLRKSYKLNAQHVFPDSFSCMKVSLAAQVLSESVAMDIEQQNWPQTKETVHFIRSVNRWFDCLNGANTYQGRRKKNPNLDPYTDLDDSRFKFLISFVQYLDDWRSQALINSANLDETLKSVASTLLDDSVRGDEPRALTMVDFDEEDDKSAGKAQLSHQTILGIEITVKSFISCTRFLISEGCPFINARVFCQDPLEQHFSKLRSGFGGSTNPNANQCLMKQNAIHIMGQLGVKRKGNTEAEEGKFQLTEEPMRKRKSMYSLPHDSPSSV